MSAEEELIKWLSREEKTFHETLEFIIKAWKAIELNLPGKYDIMLKWFCDHLYKKYKKYPESFNWNLVDEFFSLKCSPTLVSNEIKANIPEVFIKIAKIYRTQEKCIENRQFIEILFNIIEHPLFKGCYISTPTVYCRLMAAIFSTYNCYMKSLKNILPSYEREFIAKVINSLKVSIKQRYELGAFVEDFTKHTLKSFAELIIILKLNKLNFFEDALEIRRILYFKNEESVFSESHMQLPIHVILQNWEYAIVHFRGYPEFLSHLLKIIFNETENIPSLSSMGLQLQVITYIFHLFQKYNIQLNFKYSEEITAVQFIGGKIKEYVDNYYRDHLYEILNLLCCIMRLNPLILEKYIFEIVTKFMIIRKTEKCWTKYEEFLILLMEMFRKLSRPEKFVANLLKSVSEHLKDNKVSKKLKRKIKHETNETHGKKAKLDESISDVSFMTTPDEEDYEYDYYLQAILNDFNEMKQTQTFNENLTKNLTWLNIYYAWPSNSVGLSFSKFISNLLSKPSLVIWKTILYSFSEYIDALKESSPNPDDNLLFLIDFNAALLSQYFAGCRLAEQSNQYSTEIEENHLLTCDLLKKFGQTLLRFGYNNRTMNTFLEISYYLGYFDLIRFYYCPDSIQELQDTEITQFIKNLHGYLNQDEWTLIEQRILNFGKHDCKRNMNNLGLQKLRAQILFSNKKPTEKYLNIQKFLQSSTLKFLVSPTVLDNDQIQTIFSNHSNLWLIKYLTREQQLQVCDLLLMDISSFRNAELIEILKETNYEFIEMTLFNLYKYMASFLISKKSLLSLIDFDEILNTATTNDEFLKNLIPLIDNWKNEKYTIKKYDFERIEIFLKNISTITTLFSKQSSKTFIFALTLALYRDLLATGNEILIKNCCDFLIDILHFGDTRIIHYFDIEVLISIISPAQSSVFYELLFSSLKRQVEDAEKLLIKTIEILKSKEANDLNDDYLKLCMILVESVAHQSSIRKFKKYQDNLSEILMNHVNKYFAATTINAQNTENDKEFVNKTLSAYAVCAAAIFGSKKLSEDIVDDNFRKICKIYIGYSINCNNSHSIKLMRSALANRAVLHFDPDEIEIVLKKYWDQVISEVKLKLKENNKNIENAISFIMNFKTNEDFENVLLDLERNLVEDTYECTCAILSYISKSTMISTVKGPILNNYFKRITFAIMIKLQRDSNNQFKDKNMILTLLDCQNSVCENPKIPITMDLVDDILSFLMNINIKSFPITDTNIEEFFNLHQHMMTLCITLIKFRPLLITDRIPQFMHVFKDLIQAVCWYKCDRQKDASLEDHEVDNLAKLAYKLESLMNLIASLNVEIKRLAPYILTFIISLMVSNNRASTLYPKIKLHIDNICYDLISVCDHRVGNFILRCSNDAMKLVYETLCKEYRTYRKFRGKV